MPQAVATEHLNDGPDALRAQLLEPPTVDKEAGKNAAKPNAEKEQGEDEPEETEEADEESEEEEDAEETETTEEVDEEEDADESEEDPKKPKAKAEKPEAKAKPAPPKKPKGEGEEEGKTFKIGERQFKSVDEVVKEATRVIGRNANLAGEVRTLTKAKSELQKELDAAYEVNQKWVKWAEDKVGAPPSHDPKLIAAETAKALKASKDEESTVEDLTKRIDALKELENWSETEEIVEKLADKINPLTDKHYTPEEAYDLACHNLGLDNLREEEDEEEGEGAKKKAAAKPKPKSAVKSAAARPTGAGAKASGQKPKETKADVVDDMLAARDGFS